MKLHPGETAAGPWRPMEVAEVLDRLLAECGPIQRTRIIALDGRGGAGKTVLARRLAGMVPGSAVVHTDDVAWWHAYFDWAPLLIDGVLRPVCQGLAVHFQPPAWKARHRDGFIEVPAEVPVLFVEGTGVIRRELDPWIDASLYVQGDLDFQEERLKQRDGDTPEIRDHIASWLAEEIPFLAREQPWAHATLVVHGTEPGPSSEQVLVADPVRA